MRSKKSILVLSIALIFVGCKTESEGISINEPTMSVAEIQDFVNGINFTGSLASGQSVDFVPNDISRTDQSETNFTDPEQPNYTQNQGLIFDIENLGTGNGLLRVSSNSNSEFFDVKFEYVLILTFAELEILFPNEVNIHPEMKQWVLGIAFGSDRYNIEDLFDFGLDEIYGVTDFIQIILNPSDPESFEGLWITEGQDFSPFYLEGDFKYDVTSLTSKGLVEYNDFSGFYIVGSYRLSLQE